jgi:hypothetical protein
VEKIIAGYCSASRVEQRRAEAKKESIGAAAAGVNWLLEEDESFLVKKKIQRVGSKCRETACYLDEQRTGGERRVVAACWCFAWISPPTTGSCRNRRR